MSVFDSIFNSVSKGVKDAIDQSGKLFDQVRDLNNDGVVDEKDLEIFTNTVSQTVNSGVQALEDARNSYLNDKREKALAKEKQLFAPLFPEDISRDNYTFPKLISIEERDEKRKKSEVCKGSIGYTSSVNQFEVVHILADSIFAFPLQFYPDEGRRYYLRSPIDKTMYIAVETYFEYLQHARIAELQTLAQDLGAKEFIVRFKEEQKSKSDKSATIKASGQYSSIKADTDASVSSSEKKTYNMVIAANSRFPGHMPTRPDLHYMQSDPHIKNLIKMRMNESSPLLHQKLTLEMSNTCGISREEAAKISGALKSMKAAISTKFQSKIEKEQHTFLEYEIDF